MGVDGRDGRGWAWAGVVGSLRLPQISRTREGVFRRYSRHYAAAGAVQEADCNLSRTGVQTEAQCAVEARDLRRRRTAILDSTLSSTPAAI